MAVVHSESYKGLSIHKFIHKSRLREIIKIFNELKLEKKGIWADFGCSDGFYFYHLMKKIADFTHWKLCGFDYADELLEAAKKRNLANATFYKLDLNKINKDYEGLFDIVTCFETIEHTGNYKNAFENIYLSCNINGYILLSVPNETGLPGIVKFIGRKILRRSPYRYFFKNSSELKYFVALLQGEDIETFRSQEANGWGPHLGFNYKNFEKYIFEEYINKNKCDLIKRNISFFGFNILYVLKKTK